MEVGQELEHKHRKVAVEQKILHKLKTAQQVGFKHLSECSNFDIKEEQLSSEAELFPHC